MTQGKETSNKPDSCNSRCCKADSITRGIRGGFFFFDVSANIDAKKFSNESYISSGKFLKEIMEKLKLKPKSPAARGGIK